MIKFTEFINEGTDFNKIFEDNKDIFDEFLELLSDYMDFSEKSVISKLYKLVKGTSIITSSKSLYRVMVQEEGKDIDFGNREMISTSVSKVKGKTLDGIIGDMTDRYEYHKGIKDYKIVYVEISGAEGIDIYSLIMSSLKKGSTLNEYLDDYYIDMFKRLKAEKEFLAVNKNLKVKKIEEL